MTATEPTAPGPPVARRRLTAVIGVAITLGLLYWILRRTSFSDIVANLRRAHPLPLLGAVVLATATFAVRAIRWRSLLRAEDGSPLPWSARWHATAIGFMANNTLPFRLGELVRAYAGSRLGRVPLSSAFASIAVERVLDLLLLVALLALALFGAGLPADTTIAGTRLDLRARQAGFVCAGILLAALAIVFFPRAAERIIRAVVPFRRLSERLVRVLEGLRAGFSTLRSPARLAAALFWSAVHWLLNGAAFYVAFAAFDIRVGFLGALLVQSLLAFGVAPPSTPGYFVVFEFFASAGLALFGVPTALGVAYGLTYHITTFLPITILGLVSLLATGLHVRDATRASA